MFTAILVLAVVAGIAAASGIDYLVNRERIVNGII